MDEQPVLTSSLIVAAVGAALAALVAFGVPVTADQRTAILGCIPPFFVLIVALATMIDQKTVSKVRAQQLVNAAYHVGLAGAPPEHALGGHDNMAVRVASRTPTERELDGWMARERAWRASRETTGGP